MLALCGIPLLGLGALYCLVASCQKEPIKGGHPPSPSESERA